MSGKQDHKLSTSALAKALDVPSQLLFTTLKDYGWIRKLEHGWELTSKGEFDGGEYVHSKKFGRYIVWPEQLTEHPLLRVLEDNRHVTATVLGKKYGLNARQVNRLLAELGWITHSVQGWELTELGTKHGGIQLENESSGTFYIVWPETVQRDKIVTRQLTLGSHFNKDNTPFKDTDKSHDQQPHLSIDGHQHQTVAKLQVCHWLYMAGITHACHRQLPVEDKLYADFYVPTYQLYIECWDGNENSAELTNKMQRKAMYKKLDLNVVDIEKKDLENLDEVMTTLFRKLGIRIY